MNSPMPFALLLALALPLRGASAELTGRVSAADGGPALAGAIVYVVSGLQPGTVAVRRDPPGFVVRGARLEPRVLVVLTGEAFTIQNADAEVYNVQLRFRESTERNLALLPHGRITAKAERPELFARVGEDLNRLAGYICVLEHRVHALTDAAGAFTLPGLPPGTYTIEAAHPRWGRLKREITIAGAKATVDFALPGRAKATAR